MTAEAYKFVTPAPPAPEVQQTALARLDPDRVTREAFGANAAALASYLRSVAPALPAADAPTIDVDPPAMHDVGRTVRLRIVMMAIVAITGIVGAGLAFVAYRTVGDGLVTVAVFLLAWGGLALLFAQRAQLADVENAPESIHAHGQRFAMEVDAESRQALARAYADALIIDANARADVQRATAAQAQQRIDLDLARLARPARAPVEAPVTDLFPTCHTPVAAPVTDLAPAADTPAPAPTVAGVVLAWMLAGLDSGKLAPGQLVRERVPWSARSELLPAEIKPEVERRLLAVEPPLFLAVPGGQWRWGQHTRRTAAAAVRHLLGDL